jgi:hypothetical protein
MGKLLTSLRVRAEGAGIIIKTAVTFLVILLGERGSGQGAFALVAFASGQLAYALTLILIYLGHYGLKALKPQLQPGPMCVYTSHRIMICYQLINSSAINRSMRST